MTTAAEEPIEHRMTASEDAADLLAMAMLTLEQRSPGSLQALQVALEGSIAVAERNRFIHLANVWRRVAGLAAAVQADMVAAMTTQMLKSLDETRAPEVHDG